MNGIECGIPLGPVSGLNVPPYYQNKKSLCGVKPIVRSCHLRSGISYAGKTRFFILKRPWMCPWIPIVFIDFVLTVITVERSHSKNKVLMNTFLITPWPQMQRIGTIFTQQQCEKGIVRKYQMCMYWMRSLLCKSALKVSSDHYSDANFFATGDTVGCHTGIILYMRPANERRRYIVTSSRNGRVHIQNDYRDHFVYAPGQWETALHIVTSSRGRMHIQNDPWS